MAHTWGVGGSCWGHEGSIRGGGGCAEDMRGLQEVVVAVLRTWGVYKWWWWLCWGHEGSTRGGGGCTEDMRGLQEVVVAVLRTWGTHTGHLHAAMQQMTKRMYARTVHTHMYMHMHIVGGRWVALGATVKLDTLCCGTWSMLHVHL